VNEISLEAATLTAANLFEEKLVSWPALTHI